MTKPARIIAEAIDQLEGRTRIKRSYHPAAVA